MNPAGEEQELHLLQGCVVVGSLGIAVAVQHLGVAVHMACHYE